MEYAVDFRGRAVLGVAPSRWRWWPARSWSTTAARRPSIRLVGLPRRRPGPPSSGLVSPGFSSGGRAAWVGLVSFSGSSRLGAVIRPIAVVPVGSLPVRLVVGVVSVRPWRPSGPASCCCPASCRCRSCRSRASFRLLGRRCPVLLRCRARRHTRRSRRATGRGIGSGRGRCLQQVPAGHDVEQPSGPRHRHVGQGGRGGDADLGAGVQLEHPEHAGRLRFQGVVRPREHRPQLQATVFVARQEVRGEAWVVVIRAVGRSVAGRSAPVRRPARGRPGRRRSSPGPDSGEVHLVLGAVARFAVGRCPVRRRVVARPAVVWPAVVRFRVLVRCGVRWLGPGWR